MSSYNKNRTSTPASYLTITEGLGGTDIDPIKIDIYTRSDNTGLVDLVVSGSGRMVDFQVNEQKKGFYYYYKQDGQIVTVTAAEQIPTDNRACWLGIQFSNTTPTTGSRPKALLDILHDIGSVTIGPNIKHIGNYFLYEAYRLTDFIIEKDEFGNSALTSIGKYAFAYTQLAGHYDLSQLTELTEIEGQFKGCPKLEGLTLNGKITSIADESFKHCINLQNLLQINTQSNSKLTIGQLAFNYCTSLSRLGIVPEKVQTIGQYAFVMTPTKMYKNDEAEKTNVSTWWTNISSGATGVDAGFIASGWNQDVLAELKNIRTKSEEESEQIKYSLTPPVQDSQGLEKYRCENFGAFWTFYNTAEIQLSWSRMRVAASGLCWAFAMMHIYNIYNPDNQYSSFKDFIEKELHKDERLLLLDETLYNSLERSPLWQYPFMPKSGNPYPDTPFGGGLQQTWVDINGKKYSRGDKISAADLPAKQYDVAPSVIFPNGGDYPKYSSANEIGEARWGIAKAFNWQTTKLVQQQEEKENVWVAHKRAVIKALSEGKPALFDCIGAASPVAGTHGVVIYGYDPQTDKFQVADSTWSFPSDILPMRYEMTFEELLLPYGDKWLCNNHKYKQGNGSITFECYNENFNKISESDSAIYIYTPAEEDE